MARKIVTRKDAREMRKLARNHSLQQVAKLTGWHATTVWAWVNGHMRN